MQPYFLNDNIIPFSKQIVLGGTHLYFNNEGRAKLECFFKAKVTTES
jgi:hypothetical protein